VKLTATKHRLLLLLFLATALLNQCGTRKNTPITRSYHNLTSYYNILFNGRESFEKGLDQYQDAYQYDFTRLLPVYINGKQELTQKIRPQMERTIEKCSKLIRLHSISSKPEKLEKKRKLSEEEKVYYDKNEFNKYVDDAYLLMGRAYFWEMEYQTASKVLEYAAREFKDPGIRNRANVWLSRCYIELGQYREAEKILNGLQKKEGMQQQVQADFHGARADLHIRSDQYSEAIPHLKQSVRQHKNDEIPERHAFLIAQLHEEMDQPDQAFGQYAEVLDMRPDYRLAFNARLKRAWLAHLTNRSGREMKEELQDMLRKDKNEDYQDQIYYALGKIAEQNNNTEQALEYFKQSAQASTSNQNQKGISFLSLADIYFNNKKYQTAQAYYDSAVTTLQPSYPGYSDLYIKTRHLTGLVDNLNTIERQDSLQKVAQMPQSERNKLISQIIENHRRAQREQARAQQAQRQYAGQRSNQRVGRGGQTAGGWYFYSPTIRRRGETDFKRRWGDRELKDNWRLSSSSTAGFGGLAREQDTETPQEEEDQYSKTNRRYYLQDIPLTDSAMQVSHQKIQDAYFEVANIYMNDLENPSKAIEAFRDLNRRYPENPFKPGTYYYLYKMHNEMGRNQQAEQYKNRIIRSYPNSNYARVLKNPDYFRELEQTRNRIERMYAQTLQLYRQGQYSRVMDSCHKALSRFDQKNYRARFEYLKSLAIGQTQDLVSFRNNLQALVEGYPNTEVASQANGTLSYLKKTELQQIGRKFQQNKPGNAQAQKKKPDAASPSQPPASDSLYSHNTEVPYYFVVITETQNTDIGRLQFDLINFNLDYFLQKDYNTSSQTFNEFFTAVTVKRFENYEQAKKYYEVLSKKQERVFTQEQMDDYRYFFISVKNYLTLLDKKSIIEYINFFNQKVL